MSLSAALAVAGCGGSTGSPHKTADGGLDAIDEVSAEHEPTDTTLETATDVPADQPIADAATDLGASEAGDASADAGSDRADAGGHCLGNVTLDFSSLSPYWLDTSTACGAASVSGDVLTLTRSGACTASQQGGFVTLDTSKWQLCGDFDLRVDFTLPQFDTPASGSRWEVFRAFDPSSSSGIALERYDVDVAGCFPSALTYKSWTTSPTDCTDAIFKATTDVTGTMRVSRTGSTVTSYTEVASDGGAWSSFVTGTGATTTPWSIEMYTGLYNGTTDQRVTFSNLVITSSATP